jgi:hypothetical protein
MLRNFQLEKILFWIQMRVQIQIRSLFTGPDPKMLVVSDPT